jgi:hypothetical protein
MDRPESTTTAAIELQLGGSAPEGILTAADGRPHRFRGWIELAAVIEDWRIEAASEAGARDQTGATG